MNNKKERKYPYWIRGNKNNPESVIRAIARVIPEYCSTSWLDNALNKEGGFYINASNPKNIFYINEYNYKDPIRLMDETDTFLQELIMSSTTWKELLPYDTKEEYNILSRDLTILEKASSQYNVLLYGTNSNYLMHISDVSKQLLIDSIKTRLNKLNK